MKRTSLGIHMGHDRSVSVVANGELIGTLAAERVDRVKHSPSSRIPFNAIDTLLTYLNIDLKTIMYVGITFAAVSMVSASKQGVVYSKKINAIPLTKQNWRYSIEKSRTME